MDDPNEINTTRMYRRGMNEKRKIPLVYWVVGIVVAAIILLILTAAFLRQS